ncbi:MAG: DUF423 domain-containing protein [Bacteroidota bacterium]
MLNQSTYIRWASILAGLAVALGALGAHQLKDVLNPVSLNAWETGVRYQLIHAIAILILTLNYQYFEVKKIRQILNIFISGILCFSGSVYLLATQSITKLTVSWLGPITPIGGVLMISAWVLLFLQTFKSKSIK